MRGKNPLLISLQADGRFEAVTSFFVECLNVLAYLRPIGSLIINELSMDFWLLGFTQLEFQYLFNGFLYFLAPPSLLFNGCSMNIRVGAPAEPNLFMNLRADARNSES